MTTSVIRFALATSAFTAALIGCTPLEKKSAIRDTVTKEPDAAFLKRVKNDPFPAAGQMPKQTPLKAEEVAEHAASVRSSLNSPTAINGVPRAGVLGQTNVAANVRTSNGFQPGAIASDATALASDETPPPATPAATPTGTATAAGTAIRPLTASRSNIRPLNRPLNGATRRN